MPDLFLIGVHESGEYVVLGSRETGDEYRLPLDDAFREAARWETGFDTAHKESPVLRPAEVQALIRAGASAGEAAARAGWTLEKVRRFEGPILAERIHIAELAGHAHVRGHSFGQGVELRRLVEERLAERDIDPSLPRWDSRRSDDGQWIVEVRYPADHQAHVAQWRFSRSTMTVAALNDEARAITDDEPAAPPAAPRSDAPHASGQGGSHAATGSAYRDFQEPVDGVESGDDDLVADIRERAAARIRRRSTRAATTKTSTATVTPLEQGDRAIHADEELPFDTPPAAVETPAQPADEAQGTPELATAESAESAEVEPQPEAPIAQPAVEEPAADQPSAPEAQTQGAPEPEAQPEAEAKPDPASEVAPEPAREPAPEAREDAPVEAKTEGQGAAQGEVAAAAPEPATPAAPARKPAPRKRAPRANTQRAASTRGRATSGAAAKPAAGRSTPAAAATSASPATPAAPKQPANTPRQNTQKTQGSAQPQKTASGAAEGASGASGSAFTKKTEESPASAPTPARASRAKSGARGRASVPAWDDIMFGAKPGSE